MLIHFEKKYLQELYDEKKCSDKHHRYQPQVIENYIRRVETLADASNIEALYGIHSLNIEKLKGNKQDLFSLRIDRKYRLEFTISIESDIPPIVIICSIVDITNHYH